MFFTAKVKRDSNTYRDWHLLNIESKYISKNFFYKINDEFVCDEVFDLESILNNSDIEVVGTTINIKQLTMNKFS